MSENEELKTTVAELPVVEAAQEQVDVETDAVRVLSTGVRVCLKSVSASLIDEVRARVKDPDVPEVYDEEKDRKLRNPNDPAYLRALEEAEELRGRAATDAMIMFGVELIDPIPDDDGWIDQLAFLGIEVDVSNKFAREFAYKKYIAVGTPDLPDVFTASSPVTGEGVAKAMAGFRGDADGGADTGSAET